MPELSRNDLKQRINKGTIDKIYLFYGEEKMYIKTDTDRLVEKLAGKSPAEFNYHNFVSNYTLDDVAVAVQVAPFVSERNVVRVADLDMNALGKDDLDKLKAIIENVPDTTSLILTMPTLPQDIKKLGAGFNKILKVIQKLGTTCQYRRETDISLANQIVRWADKRGKKIEQADAYKLQEYVGDDLYTIKNELDKLCSYVGEREFITGEDIDLLVPRRLEADVFKLTNEIVGGNSDKAYNMLDALFSQRAEPDSILAVISNAYIDFYRMRVASDSGVSAKVIAEDFGYGNRAFVLNRIPPAVKRMTTESLRKSLDVITDTIGNLHSTSLNKRIELEKLVAKLLLFAGEKQYVKR